LVTVKGYPSGETPNGTLRLYPLVIESHDSEEQAVLFYQPFVDLYRVSAETLAEYPHAATVFVCGSWAEVATRFGSEPQDSTPGGTVELDSTTDVLVKGSLTGTEPPLLNVSELYYLDGECALVRSSVQQCQYFQQVR